jgi:hypothetical protein
LQKSKKLAGFVQMKLTANNLRLLRFVLPEWYALKKQGGG